MIHLSTVRWACRVTLAAMVMASHAPVAAADPEWVLMSRHGDCVSLSDAAQREAVFQGVSTPEALVDAIRRRGEAVTVNETRFDDTRLGEITVVEVTAPGLGLAVMLVPREVCQ